MFNRYVFFGVLLWLACCVFLINQVQSGIKDAGGVRQVIVDSGKEVKSIYKEIEEDE